MSSLASVAMDTFWGFLMTPESYESLRCELCELECKGSNPGCTQFSFSVPQFPHLGNGQSNSARYQDCLGERNQSDT